jgi:hypothetical protein
MCQRVILLFTGFYECATVASVDLAGYTLIGMTGSFQKNVTLVYRKESHSGRKMMNAPGDIGIMTIN